MKLSRRGLFGALGSLAGAAIVGRVAGKSEDRSVPTTSRATTATTSNVWGILVKPIDATEGRFIVRDGAIIYQADT